jgi:hypothetical protein
MQFRITIGTNCLTSTCCMNASYKLGPEQVSSFVSVYRVYSAGTDNILIWICEE